MNCEDILAALSKDTIIELFKAKGMDKPKKSSRSISSLITRLEVEGIQSLVNSTKIVTLKEINKELDVDLDGNPGNSRPPYFKRWKEVIIEEGLIQLMEPISKPNIEAFYEVMQMKYEGSRPRDELLQDLLDEIRLDGLQVFLSSVDRDVLLQIISDLDIGDVDDKRARSALVTAIVTGEIPEIVERTKAPKKISKTKPKLTSKISYDDCYQWYSLEELQEYARDEEIKISGTKKEVIIRVIKHLKAPKKAKKPAPEVDSEEESAASAEEESESEGEKENAEENVAKPKAGKEVKKPVSTKNKKPTETTAAKATEEEEEEEESSSDEKEEAKAAPKKTEKSVKADVEEEAEKPKKAVDASKKAAPKKGNNKTENPKKAAQAAEESESESDSEEIQELEGTVKAISIEEKPETAAGKTQKKNAKAVVPSEKPQSPIIKEGTVAPAAEKKPKK